MQTITIGDETVKQETLVPLDEQDNPVTLYGGTVTIYDDGSADVVSEIGVDDIGEIIVSKGVRDAGHPYGFFQMRTTKNKVDQSKVMFLLCSHYKTINTKWSQDKEVMSNPVGNMIYLIDSTYFDLPLQEVKDALTGQKIAYLLLEPQTYHFTNLEELKVWLGENNFWCDISDDISVKYWNRGFGN